MKLLTHKERVVQQKTKEAQTKRYNRQLQREGATSTGIQQELETHINQVIARKQCRQEIKRMSKSATRKPKKFSKRTDAYTAWVITFGHRWVTIAEIEHWGMWEVGNKISKYIDCKMKDGKVHSRLKTPEEIECQK